MENKELKYSFVERSERENVKFLLYLEGATENLKKAILEISYWRFPNVNKELITEINYNINEISHLINRVSNDQCIIIKPKIKEED